ALRRERLSPEVLAPAHRSLMEQLDYLGRHLEVDLGGNHLLKNIKALMWAGSYFDGAAAKEWRRKAERLLRRELGTQMLADGMHYERSPSYHCQVFADLLEIRAVMPPGALAVEVDDVLVRAARVVADLGHPDGLVAQFSDAGLLMAYAPGECLAAYSGTGGTVADPRARFAYEQAGYFGGRGEGSFVVVDAGPIAPDRLPAHGHGDIGSFEWSVSGQRMIVDQGVFEYLAGAKREISRSAANHNTLSIPGMDQAAFFGAFRSAFRARVTAREYAPTPTGFILEVEHDGFRRSGGPLHRRRIEVAGGHVRIEDRIDRPLAGPAFVTVLLHPDVTAKGDDAGEHNAGQILLSHAKARAKLVASGPVDVEEWFWWPNIGCEQPTMRLRLTIPPGEQTAWMEFSVTD
ncbi:MAG: heparinase II/III family protein, partial [Tsuneonella sp.]